jgi:ubiquinone/menaquinone biosynthesis C-methylase UbiE
MNAQTEDAVRAAADEPAAAARDAWDAIAPAYDRTNTPTQMWLGAEGLRRAALRAGMRFLDVAAGSGALSIPAARVGARVLAVDQSPVMLEHLRRRAHAENLDIETRVMDGHALELADDSFDLAGSQFGVMLFPDMPRGVREMARVVRPGGRVLMSVYGDPQRIEFLEFFIRAIRTVRAGFTGPPMNPAPLPFQLQQPEKLRAVMTSVGLSEVTVDTIAEPTEYRTGTDLWNWLLGSNPIVESVLTDVHISREERSAIERALDGFVRERARSAPTAVLTSPINIGVGTKDR